MINREWKTVSVRTFTSGTDSYGQINKNGYTDRSIQMVVKLYNQSNNNNVRYVDVTDIGLTKDSNITTSNKIIIDNNPYDVLYVIPGSRLNQVLMKKV